jgi:hypothetical protein
MGVGASNSIKLQLSADPDVASGGGGGDGGCGGADCGGGGDESINSSSSFVKSGKSGSKPSAPWESSNVREFICVPPMSAFDEIKQDFDL